jgi:type I restriction enzyme S subunit
MNNAKISWDSLIATPPSGWVSQKLGRVFKNRKEKDRPDLPLLAVTGTGGVVNRDTLERRDTSNSDKSKYLRVCQGDIAYNTMRMWQGVSGLVSKEGIISPAYTVCTPNDEILGKYAQYLFKLPELIKVFHRFSQGMVDDTLNLKFPHFSEIKTVIPSLQ